MIKPSCVVQLWRSRYLCYIQGLNHREVRGGHRPTHMQVIVKPVRSCPELTETTANESTGKLWLRYDRGLPRQPEPGKTATSRQLQLKVMHDKQFASYVDASIILFLTAQPPI